MADDASSSSAQPSSSKSQSEGTRNSNADISMLPETVVLLVFIRCLLLAYSPSKPNRPPAISPLAIPTPVMILSWLNDLRRNNGGLNNNSQNLPTQERQPERTDSQFHLSNLFRVFSRQSITSTPTSSQTSASTRISEEKLQLRTPRESRDSGMESLYSSSTSVINEASRPNISANSHGLHEATHTKPHRCNKCGQRFSRPWILRLHDRTHTGERPYSCPHCGREFADRSNMRAHIRRIHSKQTSPDSSASFPDVHKPQ
ncbi:hypothetical protein Aperf_G00000013829 [Anoplocephala perfoliata]